MKPITKSLTIKEALREGIVYLRTSSPSFGVDAEILLAEVIKKPREFLIAHNEEKLTFNQAAKYRHWLMQRIKGVPIPYLTGSQYFYGRKFIINKSVLVPRPETEALVEECIRIVKQSTVVSFLPESRNPSRHTLAPVIADIGTGSGVIAVSLALEIPKAKIVATDKSGTALKVATRNARRYRVAKRVTFFASDLLNEIPSELSPNIIVSNLPYVPVKELQEAHTKPDTIGLTFEPQGALDGGPDGLAVFRRFFAQIARFEQTKNSLQYLLLEHNPKQRRALWELAHEFIPEFKPKEVTPFVSKWTLL
ncbi:MAG: peptide chain release factor N(5)-glutamine methyltransferase [bacterium]|nr:peptide chain release factor N(5)-glutamine methyltransferase [bacterium]